jgi:hypothetical protein
MSSLPQGRRAPGPGLTTRAARTGALLLGIFVAPCARSERPAPAPAPQSDARTAAGPARSPQLTPKNCAAACPPGTLVEARLVRVTRSASFSGWDFTGYEVDVEGPAQVTIRNARFANPTGFRLLSVGAGNAGASVSCSHCEFDGEGLKPLFEAGVLVAAGSRLATDHSRWRRAPNDFGSVFGDFHSQNDVVEAPGVNGRPDAHLEAFHVYSGQTSFIADMFDFRNHGHIPGAFTAFVFPEGVKASPTVTIRGSVFRGTRSVGMNYAFQVSRASLSLEANSIERGTSGYIARGADAGVEGLKNRDEGTGASID